MAVRFDASGEQYTSTAGLPSGDFTIAFWAYLSVDRNDYGSLFALENGPTNASGYYIYTDNDGTTLRAEGPSGTVTGDSLTVGVWHRMAMVLAGTTGTFYSAPSGAALATYSGGVGSSSRTNLFLGGDSYTVWFNGRLAAVKMWDVALTLAEIEHELGQYQPVRTANLLRYHPFVNAETVDYSGLGNILSGGSGATTEAGPPIHWEGRIRSGLFLPAATARDLDGSASSSAGATGSLDVVRAAAGTGSVAGSAAGSASVDRDIAAIATAASGASGDLASGRVLTASTSAASDASASLSVARAVDAHAASVGAAMADLGVLRALDGASPAASDGTGTAAIDRPLSGGCSDASDAAGELSAAGESAIDGAVDAASSASGSLSIDHGLTGTGASASSATAGLVATRALVGYVGAASSAGGELSFTVALTGWPPDITGPFPAPLIAVAVPTPEPLVRAAGPTPAPLLAVSGPHQEAL